MLIQGRLTTITDGSPVPDNTDAEIRTEDGNTLIATVQTNNGFYSYSGPGNPGPFYIEWEYGGVTRRVYSRVTGPSAALDVGRLPLVLQGYRNGIFEMGGQLAASATGADLNVSVANGLAVVEGIVYDNVGSPVTLAVDAGDGQPRIDSVVVRVNPPGSGVTIEGKAELAIVKGTPGASPVAPTLSTSTPYEMRIANITVPASAAVIGSGDVANLNPQAVATLPSGGIGTNELADGAVTNAKLGNNSVSNAKLADNSVSNAKLVNNSVSTSKIADSQITTDKVADLAITNAKLGNNSVGASKIVDSNISTQKIVDLHVTTAKLADLAVTEAKLASSAVTASKLATNSVGTSKIIDANVLTAKIANSAVTTDKLANGAVTLAKLSAAGRPVYMPVGEFVATGVISSGTRTLITLGVGPLINGVQYAIFAYAGVTIRNNINTGTTIIRCAIAGGAQATHEVQCVGGVPRWAPITQTASIAGTGASVNVVQSIQYNSGDQTDVRAGWLQIIALPASILSGA